MTQSLLAPGLGVCLRLLLDKPVTDADLVFNIPMLDAEKYYRRMWENHEIPDGLPPVGAEAGKNVSGMATEMAIESGYRCADHILEHTSVNA